MSHFHTVRGPDRRQRLDAGVKAVMKVDAVAVSGDERRHLALDRHQCVIGVGAG